jgi:hypothetical protein
MYNYYIIIKIFLNVKKRDRHSKRESYSFFFEKSLYSKNKLGTLYKQKTVIRRGVIKGTGTGQSPDHVVPVGNKMFLDCFYFVYS